MTLYSSGLTKVSSIETSPAEPNSINDPCSWEYTELSSTRAQSELKFHSRRPVNGWAYNTKWLLVYRGTDNARALRGVHCISKTSQSN